MFISANKIIEIIEAAKACEEKLPEGEQRIHVRDIAGTLQKLIDDEQAEMDKMADEAAAAFDADLFHGARELNAMAQAADMEEEEWGRLQMEEAVIEKELLVDYDWPGGL